MVWRGVFTINLLRGSISERRKTKMDIVVCGNPTIDELVQKSRVLLSAGGSALFSSCAAAYLGSRVGILGNVGDDYPPSNLRRLRTLHVDLSFLRTNAGPSTRFRITRINRSRELRLIDPCVPIAAPWSSRRYHGIHLGPVFNEISDSLMRNLRKRCEFLSADLQGFIRTVSGSVVRTVPRNLNTLLGHCDMVQASIEEARTETRLKDPKAMLSRFLKMRVRYAIVTMGEAGSWLGSRRDGSYLIPAFQDRSIRDLTGAGDVFAGSWLSTYLSTKDPVWASAVGSAFASLASRRSGLSKFRPSRRELFRRASWVYAHVEASRMY